VDSFADLRSPRGWLARGGVARSARAGAVGGASLLAALLLAMSAGAVAATPPSATETFKSTGLEQAFTVPAGVTSVHVQAIGAAGHAGTTNNDPYESGAPGGVGADVTGELPVTPGETLYVEVAGDGVGGAGTPGAGGGEGGGASDVRTVSSTLPESLESRLLVAGGGGGGGGAWDLSSGGRGGNAGADGAAGDDGEFGEGGAGGAGGAGTLTGGGAGGTLCEAPNSWSGTAGALGLGGAGGVGIEPDTGGGGGGGGYWGGGGGEGACGRNPFTAGGGGGGSSYAAEGVTSPAVGLAAASTEPSVTISYTTPAPVTPEASTISSPGVQPQQGPQGPQGPAGPQGERGPAGPAAVYECHPREGHGKFATACFVHVAVGSPSVLKATLRRGGAVYATGPVTSTGAEHGKGLTLRATRVVPAGRYRLVLVSRGGASTSRYVTVK
jgi:hypothetical protein